MTQISQQLVALVPVLAGALIALMGGGIKQWIDRREQRRQRRQEKLERLFHLVYQLKPWSDGLDSNLAFGITADDIPSPIEEIEVIGNLYFHELQVEIEAIAIAAKKYKGAMLNMSATRLNSGVVPADAGHKINEYYQPLLAAIRAFTARARLLAKSFS